MNVVDFSNRRGAIVHLLPQVHALINGGLPGGSSSPSNYVLWNHNMSKALVDVNRKWLFALEETRKVRSTDNVKGIFFYRLGTDGRSVYVDTLIAPKGIIEPLLTKFERDDAVKVRESFYVSRNIRKEAAEEILETVGLQDENAFDGEGYQLLGGLAEAVNELKMRYLR